jgi:hypothetical protein
MPISRRHSAFRILFIERDPGLIRWANYRALAATDACLESFLGSTQFIAASCAHSQSPDSS